MRFLKLLTIFLFVNLFVSSCTYRNGYTIYNDYNNKQIEFFLQERQKDFAHIQLYYSNFEIESFLIELDFYLKNKTHSGKKSISLHIKDLFRKGESFSLENSKVLVSLFYNPNYKNKTLNQKYKQDIAKVVDLLEKKEGFKNVSVNSYGYFTEDYYYILVDILP